eukprot:2893050-Pyramimonas_sp.AAC.1
MTSVTNARNNMPRPQTLAATEGRSTAGTAAAATGALLGRTPPPWPERRGRHPASCRGERRRLPDSPVPQRGRSLARSRL